jgi:hypothetical protein
MWEERLDLLQTLPFAVPSSKSSVARQQVDQSRQICETAEHEMETVFET